MSLEASILAEIAGKFGPSIVHAIGTSNGQELFDRLPFNIRTTAQGIVFDGSQRLHIGAIEYDNGYLFVIGGRFTGDDHYLIYKAAHQTGSDAQANIPMAFRLNHSSAAPNPELELWFQAVRRLESDGITISSEGTLIREPLETKSLQTDKPTERKTRSELMTHLNPITLIAAFATCFALTNCASPTAPAANDWTTVYRGRGSVGVTVNNQSQCSMFMKIQRTDNTVAAQVELAAMGSETVSLGVGSYGCKVKILTVPAKPGDPKFAMKPGNCYRAPGIDVPANAAHLSLTLKVASSTNLKPITDQEFDR